MFKFWDYHHTPGHGAWKDTQGGASGTGGHTAAAVAAVGGRADSDGDLIPFIGWLIEQIFCYVIGEPVRQSLGWLLTSLENVLLGFMVKRDMVMKILALQEFYKSLINFEFISINAY